MIQGQCDGFVSSQPIRLSAHGRQHPPRKTVRRNSRCKFPSRSIPGVVGQPSESLSWGAVVEGWPTTPGIDLLGNLHLELRRTVFLGGCWRRWALSLIVVVTTNDGNRSADSRNHCDTRRLAKCAIVSVPTHKAILPCACLRSLTTRAGCGAPCTYKRALSPCTSIFSLVHSPGTTSA